ncbi:MULTISPECIES: hypothetical protein [unclassified Holdemanella]|uniref:hypothetical protein n=1 Tax=unclassified Holdemanella TaxID=2633909 RepID=UPI001D09A60D|nr:MULTISPECIES: hypothetical protein [unclassified Holdemanella]MCB8640020.1 hypothetical protein [Holdemanella sp. DFI.5.55]MCG5648837.1 hypothetical protein [Holdemanella sp. DFI.5.21]
MSVYELLRKYHHMIDTNLNEAQNLLYDGELDWVAPIIIEARGQIELMLDVIDCITNEHAKKAWKKDFNFLREYYKELNEEFEEEKVKQRNEE